MTKVIRVHQLGGPEVLQIEDIAVGDPGPGEVRIKVEAVGLNRSEAMYRAGRYPVKPQLPSLIGYEGVGTIEAVGAGVTDYKEGDRVCVLPMIHQGQYGIWAEQAIVPARILLPAPPGLSAAEAASIWMQYMTAFALIEVAEVGLDDGVIVRAASSSVGIAAIQLANWAGAVSIAATRTSAKADALLAHGAAHVVATEEDDLVERVMDITGGKGAYVAFDPVGGLTSRRWRPHCARAASCSSTAGCPSSRHPTRTGNARSKACRCAAGWRAKSGTIPIASTGQGKRSSPVWPEANSSR